MPSIPSKAPPKRSMLLGSGTSRVPETSSSGAPAPLSYTIVPMNVAGKGTLGVPNTEEGI